MNEFGFVFRFCFCFFFPVWDFGLGEVLEFLGFGFCFAFFNIVLLDLGCFFGGGSGEAASVIGM